MSFSYDQELHAMVNDFAPRLFAVVQEYDTESGERDGEIAAWGLTHPDGHTDVTSVEGTRRASTRPSGRPGGSAGRRTSRPG
ncbi:hypothetical protein ABZ370_27855 [Streptomyces sp. NPDC005962]|uniref:hypothetical protein n=1 Tax=Streptomyces sp. NPDC005962 TaxID=3154466 RepID=UPI0034024A65